MITYFENWDKLIRDINLWIINNFEKMNDLLIYQNGHSGQFNPFVSEDVSVSTIYQWFYSQSFITKNNNKLYSS